MLKNILVGKIRKEFSGGEWWFFQGLAYIQPNGDIETSVLCGKTEGEVSENTKKAVKLFEENR